jgi:hypothetical protein
MQPIGADSDETDSSVWSRDGAFLLFRVNDALGWVPAEGTGPIHKLEGELRGGATPRLMTPDGRLLLLYRNYERGTDSGGWWVAKINLSEGRLALTEPKQLAGHKEHEGFLISPDGQWLAYNSMESGRREAYVTPFKLSGKPDKSWLVSTQGGYPLAWSKTGRQLFYMSNGLIYVASWSARGDEFTVGQARPWTNTKIRGMGAVKLLDFAPDEKRWIVLADDTEVLPETHLRLLLNVNQELNRRAAKAGGTK